MKNRWFLSEKIERLFAALGITIFTAGLALFGYTGLFARLWADDYCYSGFIKTYGWWQGIVQWYLSAGTRFSTIATVGLVDVFGIAETPLQPGLLLIFWVAAWFYLLLQASQVAGWKVEKSWLFLIALAQVYFVTLLAPDRIQTIYWRVATLHYAFPLPWLMLHFAFILKYLRSRSWVRFWPLFLAGVSAFYIAGQSETTSFMQAAIFGVGLLASWFLLKGSVRSRAAGLMAVSLTATIVVMAIMFLSPDNDRHLEGMLPPDNLWLIIPVAFRYVFDFIFYSIRGQIIPYLAFFGLSLAVSLLIQIHSRIELSNRSWLSGVGGTLALMVLFIFSSFAPSAYANLQYPGVRALMPGCFLLLFGLSLTAFFLVSGMIKISRQVGTGWLRTGALLLLVLSVLYPLRPVPYLLNELETMSVWAERWDARDQEIREAKANGIVDVQVRQIEVIRNLEDLGPDPGIWVNICAARFYGVRTITAIP